MEYKIVYSNKVVKMLDEIYGYIKKEFKSEQAAKKRIADIDENLRLLEVFPEAGIDADERFGIVVNEEGKTRVLTLKTDYLAFYLIDYEKHRVLITHLVSTRSDYLRMLIKKDSE